ncbi:MAG: hypothetical protein IJT40_03530 [Firmicutes bacterium]|nr:hypothetical protein [Bacillota bacterium]
METKVIDKTEYLTRKRKPSKRPKMSIEDRAKQFGAFDPLTGFGDAIRRKEIEMEALLTEKTQHVKSEDDI